MKEIYLVRHGDTDATERGYYAGWMDIPLSAGGRARILRVREMLPRDGFRKVLVSPLKRTLETARIVVEDAPLEICEELKERSFGSWEGRGWKEIEENFPEEMAAWRRDPLRFTPPGGESFEVVLARVVSFWERLRLEPEGRYLLVTHGGVIRSLLVHLLRLDFASTFHILLDPGVVVKIREENGFSQLVHIVNVEGGEG
ncbi:MAG: alpha-ribazole phosphatase [Candidatus Atribacteria bacterium]|nr:alpha-ribazole phosphatase [Candidatus Atribacteria bacterium]